MILNYFCSILRSYGNSQIKSSHLVPFSALMILPQLQSTDSMTYIIIIMCRIFRNLDYNSRNRCLTLFLTALMVPVDIIKSIYGSLTLLPNLLPIYGPDWINCCLVILTIGDHRSVANDRIAWMTCMLNSLYKNFGFIFSFDS